MKFHVLPNKHEVQVFVNVAQTGSGLLFNLNTQSYKIEQNGFIRNEFSENQMQIISKFCSQSFVFNQNLCFFLYAKIVSLRFVLNLLFWVLVFISGQSVNIEFAKDRNFPDCGPKMNRDKIHKT